MEDNLLNGPLATVQILSKKIFKSMLDQIKIFENNFFNLFYFNVALLVFFFFVLVYLSIKYLGLKLTIASMLISVDVQDIEHRITKLNQYLDLFTETELSSSNYENKMNQEPEFYEMGKENAQKISLQSINKKTANLKKKNTELFVVRNSAHHRRSKNPSKDALSLSFNWVVLACFSAVFYLSIYRIFNF